MAIEPRRHRPEWEDMSNYVVHFTRTISAKERAADNIVVMLRAGQIEARNRYGVGYNDARAPIVVCLTETPVHQLSRILQRRGPYGIGFTKEFVIASGGGPILYA